MMSKIGKLNYLPSGNAIFKKISPDDRKNNQVKVQSNPLLSFASSKTFRGSPDTHDQLEMEELLESAKSKSPKRMASEGLWAFGERANKGVLVANIAAELEKRGKPRACA